MGVKFSPIGNGTNWIPGSGLIANGYKLFFYAAGTTTKQNTYTSNTGGTPNSNPITLNAYGRSANEIWLTEGLYYKVVIASGSDTDPPSSGVTLGDYITGINDFSSQVSDDQWTASGLTPTYISTTSFSVAGDNTTALHVGRRLKTTNTGGTIYSTITASVYGSVTTVTVVNDSGTLDSGLSAVSYGILTSTNPSIPKIALVDGSTATSQSNGDNSTKITNNLTWSNAVHGINDFRLTLTTGTPVTTSDVTGATTVYMTPYTGNRIGLYDGSNWAVYSTAEISVALGTITSDQGYDVFCYANSGVPTLEILAWTNNTTRATALVMQDGILCKTGALTRRYIGSFLTTSTTTTEDSSSKRYLFNYYNRVEKPQLRVDSTASWNYASATIRQANNSASNQINFFIGVVEQPVKYSLSQVCVGSGVAAALGCVGLNTTSSYTNGTAASSTGVSDILNNAVSGSVLPITGKNYLSWNESSPVGTTTFYGTSSNYVSYLSGSVYV